MVSRTDIQHERSNSLVAMVVHRPVGSRLRSECPPTMASAPPRPSGTSPLTGWFANSCVRRSPVTANSPSAHVATSVVRFATDRLPSPLPHVVDALEPVRGDELSLVPGEVSPTHDNERSRRPWVVGEHAHRALYHHDVARAENGNSRMKHPAPGLPLEEQRRNER